MPKKTFEQIKELWQAHEQQMLNSLRIDISENCLSFAELKAWQQGDQTPEQQKHVAQCQYCQKMLEQFEKYHLHIEKKPEKWFALADFSLIKIGESIVEFLRPVPVTIKYAVPVLLFGVALFLILRSPNAKFAKLARIEPMNFQMPVVRGKEVSSKASQLFTEGMEAYLQKNYSLAIQKLAKSYDLDQTDVNTNFYLGLCYLLNQRADKSLDYFENVFVLKGEFLYEKCYWYSGNAYLLMEDRDKALEMFEKVVNRKGDYAWEAKELVHELEKRIR